MYVLYSTAPSPFILGPCYTLEERTSPVHKPISCQSDSWVSRRILNTQKLSLRRFQRTLGSRPHECTSRSMTSPLLRWDTTEQLSTKYSEANQEQLKRMMIDLYLQHLGWKSEAFFHLLLRFFEKMKLILSSFRTL